MKIKKGLSDAEMLKGYNEQVTFENDLYNEEKNTLAKIKATAKSKVQKILLPPEECDRLNRFLLEISLECLKNKKPCSFQVTRESDAIIIRPSPLTK